MKKRTITKAEKLAKAKAELDKALGRTGYNHLKAKHGKVSVVGFPNYKTESPNYPSLGDGFAPASPKKQLHPDAKEFPICMNHKQGPMLLTKADDITYAGGKKT